MEIRIDEIGDRINRLSTCVPDIVPPAGFTFNRFLILGDECGAMNEWLAVSPDAQVAHGMTGCLVLLNDMADRPPRVLSNGDVIDIGGKRIRYIDTPHVPHGWDAR